MLSLCFLFDLKTLIKKWPFYNEIDFPTKYSISVLPKWFLFLVEEHFAFKDDGAFAQLENAYRTEHANNVD